MEKILYVKQHRLIIKRTRESIHCHSWSAYVTPYQHMMCTIPGKQVGKKMRYQGEINKRLIIFFSTLEIYT